jgi:hypothetical protein
MTTNWEGALKSITDHSQALGVVILDGSTRYAWCQTELILPLAKPEGLLKELPAGTDSFRAARLGSHLCLLYLISQPDGSRCAFIYPLTTHLAAAKTDAQAFTTAARLVPPVSLDSLKVRDLHAYKHTPENATWQAEFLALYSDTGQTDHSVTLPEQEDMATRPVSLFTESTRPIQLQLPGALSAEVAEEAYWVKIV